MASVPTAGSIMLFKNKILGTFSFDDLEVRQPAACSQRCHGTLLYRGYKKLPLYSESSHRHCTYQQSICFPPWTKWKV